MEQKIEASEKKGLHVVYIDDNDKAGFLMHLVIERISPGAICRYFPTIEQAIEYIRLTIDIDHIISDLNIEHNYDGFTLYRELKEKDILRQARFSILTGSIDEQVLEQGHALGIAHILPKPISADELKKILI